MKKIITVLFFCCFLSAQFLVSGCANAVQKVDGPVTLNTGVEESSISKIEENNVTETESPVLAVEQELSTAALDEAEAFTDEAEMAGEQGENAPVALAEPEEERIYHFRNNKLLTQHYEKHGIEMGFASKEEYEQAASDVITNPKALYKTEAEDGDGVYYVEETNEFAILSTDGYIRTYFLPDKGIDYFNRQ